MRGLLIGIAAVGAMMATPAPAQHHGGSHSGGHAGQRQGGGHWQGRPGGSWHWNGHKERWGGAIHGRWHGGARAPGGWAAYRRPVRGWVLPSYWISPGWRVWDWADYGLYPPPQGYSWSRYYDDAVLIDGSGQVRDSRDDVDWDAYDQGYDDGYRDGYQDSRQEDVDGPPPPPEGVRFGPRVEVVQPLDGPRIDYPVTTTCVGSCEGVVEGGYYYPPATRTTITIPARPVVTTTTATHPAKTYVIERAVPTEGKTVRKIRKIRKVRRK